MKTRNLISAALVPLILLGSAFSNPFASLAGLCGSVVSQLAEPFGASLGDAVPMRDLSANYDGGFAARESLLRGNGAFIKALGMRGFYGDIGIYIYDNGYIISPNGETSAEYEAEQMKRLAAVCADEGVPLLYVNAPRKYLDDSVFARFGMESFVNRNADAFLSKLALETDVPYIDLRVLITAEGKDSFSLFYRTDHHWTTRTGLWAARAVASGLNERCGLSLDLSRLDDDRFLFTDYPSAWVGEQGRKISVGYIGKDDYTLIVPRGETHYTVTDLLSGRAQSGSFDIMTDLSVIKGDPAELGWKSWHYIYMPQYLSFTRIENKDLSEGKILYLCDSFSYAVVPFLSACVGDVTTVVLRDLNEDFDLFELIREGDYDAVVILYAEFMIGAHDSPLSSNRRMFSFDNTFDG